MSVEVSHHHVRRRALLYDGTMRHSRHSATVGLVATPLSHLVPEHAI